ncbi:ATP-binding protein [Candidatus Latescibacterota bacterium]
MEDLSLHILDIAENAVRADAKKIVIDISEDENNDLLTICISDDGLGMDEEMVKHALDPFFTTKNGKRIGLGLSMLSQAAREADGKMELKSEQGAGTKIKANFKLSHPDMKPLGNIFETLTVLITGCPSIQFIYNYSKGDYDFSFDSNR